MENIYIIITFILTALCAGTVSIQCSSGQRVDILRNGSEICVPCETYTFVAEDNHSHRTCKPCAFIEDPDVEVFVSFCNRTHDSVIFCTSGFYRRRARNDQQADRCEKCTECEFPTRACGGYYDTVCCHPNQEAVLTSNGVYGCRAIPIVCGPGQFFSTSTEECLTCPAETFMSAHNHTYKECLKCEQLSENNATHAIITRPCSRTAPTLFGCKDGYFRDPTQESLQKEVPCTPCRSCQLSLTECHMFHDAVCDVQDTMSSAAPANITQSTSLAVDADNMTDGTSLLNGTLESGDRKQFNDAIMECQKPASHDVVALSTTCVIIVVILSSTLYPLFWTDKPNAIPYYCNSKIARRRFITNRLVVCCVCVLLSINVIVCLTFKTVNPQIFDVVTGVFVVLNLAADEIYIAVINVVGCGLRRPNKQQGKRKSQLDTMGEVRQDTNIQGEQTKILIPHQEDMDN